MLISLTRFIFRGLKKPLSVTQLQKCHSVFGIKDLIHQEKVSTLSDKNIDELLCKVFYFSLIMFSYLITIQHKRFRLYSSEFGV